MRLQQTLGAGFLREMKPGEEGAVDALLRAAFEGEDEVKLVAALRKSGVIASECVVPGREGPLGYFALSALIKPKAWLCLAPVAVLPHAQRQGIGLRMMKILVGWAQASQQRIVVLGEPDFYQRAGFSKVRAARLETPYSNDFMMLLAPGTEAPQVELVYPSAFDT